LNVPGCCSTLGRACSSAVENECDRPCFCTGRNGLAALSGQLGSSWLGFFWRCDLLRMIWGVACAAEKRDSLSSELDGLLEVPAASSPPALSGGVGVGKTNGAWAGGDCKRWLPGRTTGLYMQKKRRRVSQMILE